MTKHPKPYKLTRHYLTLDGIIKTYNQHLTTLDHVHKSIVHMIDRADSYKFDHHKMIIKHHDNTTITVELHNESKPCIIPIVEILESAYVDPKYKP